MTRSVIAGQRYAVNRTRVCHPGAELAHRPVGTVRLEDTTRDCTKRERLPIQRHQERISSLRLDAIDETDDVSVNGRYRMPQPS
jgi:hypothetical protein